MKLIELREAATRLEVEINKKNPQLAEAILQRIKSKIKFSR